MLDHDFEGSHALDFFSFEKLAPKNKVQGCDSKEINLLGLNNVLSRVSSAAFIEILGITTVKQKSGVVQRFKPTAAWPVSFPWLRPYLQPSPGPSRPCVQGVTPTACDMFMSMLQK